MRLVGEGDGACGLPCVTLAQAGASGLIGDASAIAI